MLDYILNGQGFGSVASALCENDFDLSVLRPIRSERGTPYIVRMVRNNESGKFEAKCEPVANTGIVAALRRDDWLHLDTAVIKAAKPRLRLVGDLRGAGLSYSIPNGFGKTVMQYESMTDITEASIAMDPNVETAQDRPTFDITNLPLPIIHKDFSFSTRQIAASRASSTPLDTSTAELAARRVAEMAERLAVGTSPSYAYGGGTAYGMTIFPSRLTKTLTNPTANGWTPDQTVDEVLAMKEQSQLNFHYGPWMLYTTTKWDKFLDADYSAAKGDNTLRQRLRQIEGIRDVRSLDYLDSGGDYQMILVQQSGDVLRIVIGMDIITVQWEPTPFRVNFKVMCIMVPQLRTDSNGKTGIVHGTAP